MRGLDRDDEFRSTQASFDAPLKIRFESEVHVAPKNGRVQILLTHRTGHESGVLMPFYDFQSGF